jgi:transcription-repair coupling factor (superfamily II helicase)
VIAEAIHKEIERGGQCFFVNDRIGDLDKIAMDLQMLLPSVRFGIAHGQLTPAELERIMEAFIEGKYDVIVTTKIVESGLDIPNANTIFINRADNFGLAELYQLRGRVGRTNKQAYCYLLIPAARKIARKALQRLQAIEEFTDLGSGFQLAMRDLEIRGAGNLLGSEQSGFIIELGFELYQKILDEAVQELKRQEFSKFFEEDEKPKSEEFYNEEIAIDIDLDAILPIKYITNDTDRFVFYQKLYKVKDLSGLEKIREELEDRFGKLPKEAENLLFVVKLRISAVATGFSRISLKKDKMICEFPPETNERYYKEAFPLIIEYIQSIGNSRLNQTPKKLTWEVGLSSRESAFEMIWRIKKTMELLNED